MIAASSRVRRGRGGRGGGGGGGAFDFWPGFVDALTVLLLLVTFLLCLFVLGEYLLSRQLSGQDDALSYLRRQIAELTDLLALERREKAESDERIALLSETLNEERAEKERLSSLLEGAEAAEGGAAMEAALVEERASARAARQEVARLNRQLAALRRQLGSLQAALEASERRDKESEARIAELGKRLNTALAQKVQELARHRSAFLASLRNLLKGRKGFRIVGDRFILESEVLFASGSADISARGRWELRQVAQALNEVRGEIPSSVSWVLRVDGHTDAAPIFTEFFPSNWHLSAGRAISVVEYLILQGIPPERLMAAGFGEFRPLDRGRSAAAYQRNRRIEFRLTPG